jgi:hypothetical protein
LTPGIPAGPVLAVPHLFNDGALLSLSCVTNMISEDPGKDGQLRS